MSGKLLPLHRIEGVVEEMSDDALLAACAIGESAGLGALFDRYHQQLYRFLDRLAGTQARDLDDLVQATFLEVRRSAARFSGRSSVRTWIFGIAANLVRHHIRGEVRRRTTAHAYAVELPSWSALPDDTAAHRQLLDRLGEAIHMLPHDLRVAFVMCEIEEVSGVEAARVLGVREKTVWRRLHDARKQLRRLLEGTGS